MAGRQCGKKVSIAWKIKEAGQGHFLKVLGTAQGRWGAPLKGRFRPRAQELCVRNQSMVSI